MLSFITGAGVKKAENDNVLTFLQIFLFPGWWFDIPLRDGIENV